MIRVKQLIPAAIVPLLLLSPLAGQQGETFRSQSNLVLVPVEVRNHNQHVPGLDKDKFTLLQDGKPQKIAVFEEVRTTTERLKRAAVGPKQFSNMYEGSPATARYTIIAIDRINTSTMDMQRLRIGLMKFLTQVADSGEPIRMIAINSSSIEMLQDFTTNPKVLAMALDRNKTPAGKVSENSTALNESLAELSHQIESNPQGADDDAQAQYVAQRLAQLDGIKNTEQNAIAFKQRSSRINSLEALQMVAQSLEGLPGRKSLVWASSGYPFGISVREGRSTTTMDFSQISEAGNLDEYTMHLLNTGNIAVYPVDARGTVNTAYDVMDPTHKYSATYAEKESARYNNSETITTFEHLAAATGGKACFERSDLSGCFKDAIDDSRDYYIVGYYVDSDMKPGWHKLQAKVAADGSVRSRAGFIYTKLDPSQLRVDDLRLQLASRLIDSGIPFLGQWDIKEPKGDKKDVGFSMKIMPEAKVVNAQETHLNLEILAVARARDGSVAGQFTQKIDRQLQPGQVTQIENSGIQYKNVMTLAAGDYMVRLVVRDNNTGKMGSTTTMVKVD
jgi:VWFA-related protein